MRGKDNTDYQGVVLEVAPNAGQIANGAMPLACSSAAGPTPENMSSLALPKVAEVTNTSFRASIFSGWRTVPNRRVGHRPLSGGGHTAFDFGMNSTPRFCRSLSYRAAASMNSMRAERRNDTDRLIAGCGLTPSLLPHSKGLRHRGWLHARKAAGRVQSASTNSICSSTDSWRTWSNKDVSIA